MNTDAVGLLLLGLGRCVLVLPRSRRALCLLCSLAGQPDSPANVVVAEFVEDAVGGKCDEVVLLRDLERLYVWQRLYNVWISVPVL